MDHTIVDDKEGEVDALTEEVTGSEFALMTEQLTFSKGFELLKDPNVWVYDTAATVHSTAFIDGLRNLHDANNEGIMMGNGNSEKTMKIGELNGTKYDKHGNEVGKVRIRRVRHLKNAMFNLFSGTQLLKDGWKLQGDHDKISLTKGDVTLDFDILIPTPEGVLYAMYVERETPAGEVVGVASDQKMRMSVQQAHRKLGHCGEEETRKIDKALGWTITRGSMLPCVACAEAKAKQKNVPKVSDHEPTTDTNGRVHLDLATIKTPKGGSKITKPNWRIIVDEKTQLKFSDFFETKNGMVEPTCELFQKWKAAGIPVRILRMDNAGENKLLEQRCNSADWKFDIKFEYTARDTPQQNHLAEIGFAVLANRGRALMADANAPLKERYLIFGEAFKTATLLDGLTVIDINGVKKTRFEHWNGELPRFVKGLRTWGEAGVVKTRTIATPKVANRGVQCMMVGYALGHAHDCYRMLNWETKRIHVTRDVIWLRRMYFSLQNPVGVDVSANRANANQYQALADNDSDDDDVANVNNAEPGVANEEADASEHDDNPVNNPTDSDSGDINPEDDDDDSTEDEPPIGMRTKSGRRVQAPMRWIVESETAAIETPLVGEILAMTFDVDGIPELITNSEVAGVGAGLGGGFANTNELHVMKYDEAMRGSDKHQWTQAVKEEFDRMNKHGVFEVVKASVVPKEAKVLTSTWAMKKKSNGTFRARLNARGYEQIDGEHYDEFTKAAPVVNTSTIFIVMILMTMGKLHGELMDVCGAFLHGEFDRGEEIYMKIPQGFEKFYPSDILLKLKKTIYGLKQSAYTFWVKLVRILRQMGLKRSKADPCLYFRWGGGGTLNIWISWVDDLLSVGTKNDVWEGKQKLKTHFEIDEVGELKEYVGCKVEYNKQEGWTKLTQPVLLQSFVDEFKIPNEKSPTTPAVANTVLTRDGESKALSDKEHADYRKGVGKLIHLSKFSRPDIANAVRELSRYASRPTKIHKTAMIRCMAYCVGTPNRGILLNPNARWDGSPNFEFTISGVSDSDYAKDPETRRSVAGYATFLNGACYARKSKMEAYMTLSVTEAECVAAVYCAQEMMLFGMRILQSMGYGTWDSK